MGETAAQLLPPTKSSYRSATDRILMELARLPITLRQVWPIISRRWKVNKRPRHAWAFSCLNRKRKLKSSELNWKYINRTKEAQTVMRRENNSISARKLATKCLTIWAKERPRGRGSFNGSRGDDEALVLLLIKVMNKWKLSRSNKSEHW